MIVAKGSLIKNSNDSKIESNQMRPKTDVKRNPKSTLTSLSAIDENRILGTKESNQTS